MTSTRRAHARSITDAPTIAATSTATTTPAPTAPTTTDHRVPTLDGLRSLVREVAEDVAVLDGTPGANARARLLVDALAPIVRLPSAGNAQVEHEPTVTLRELSILQRWLARTPAAATSEVVRAMTRIRSGLASF